MNPSRPPLSSDIIIFTDRPELKAKGERIIFEDREVKKRKFSLRETALFNPDPILAKISRILTENWIIPVNWPFFHRFCAPMAYFRWILDDIDVSYPFATFYIQKKLVFGSKRAKFGNFHTSEAVKIMIVMHTVHLQCFCVLFICNLITTNLWPAPAPLIAWHCKSQYLLHPAGQPNTVASPCNMRPQITFPGHQVCSIKSVPSNMPLKQHLLLAHTICYTSYYRTKDMNW